MNVDSNAIVYAKTLLGISDTDSDDLLFLLGLEAEQNALAATHNELVLADDVVLSRMIQFAYNHNNSEGLSSQSFAGVSESYALVYPNAIMQALRGYNKIKVL